MPDFANAVLDLTGVRLSEEQLGAFETYAHELITWNERFNLTGITDPQQIYLKHFLDSLSCWPELSAALPVRVIDVGTGAGFPGLPLKILQPEIQLTLLEATAKKTAFLEHIVQVLRLEGVTVLLQRAEQAGQQPEHREAYDWALARAVAGLPVLVEYLLPFLRLGGKAIAQKGETGPAEAQGAERALSLLGGRINQVVPLELPGVAEPRFLVVMEKAALTPADYPRRAGVPSKRPLG